MTQQEPATEKWQPLLASTDEREGQTYALGAVGGTTVEDVTSGDAGAKDIAPAVLAALLLAFGFLTLLRIVVVFSRFIGGAVRTLTVRLRKVQVALQCPEVLED